MSSKENAQKIVELVISHCKEKGYQVKQIEKENNFRLDVSNLRERTIVNIFFTGTINIQGQDNSIKREMEDLKVKIESNPQIVVDINIKKPQAVTTKYDIMLPEIRDRIKGLLNTIDSTVEITNKPTDAIAYRAKLNRKGFSLTVTQFNNGTLMLQGKEDTLHNDCCDLVEKVANPSDKDVIARFISRDEESLRLFTAKYTPDLIAIAEKNVKDKIGDAYNYLEPYDKKYFVAAETLLLSGIPLPEYSPIVMPASKAFEGLAKKLVVGIGLCPIETTNFSILNDKKNSTRINLCNKEKHCDTFLIDLSVAIKKHRHFMMHSDDSKVTKVDTLHEAEEKLKEVYKETKKFFDYFNSVFNLLS
jgi:hypothetical protein